jgi:hypothetical protein
MHRRTFTLAAIAAASCLFLPLSAAAQTAATPFASAGQLVVSSDATGSVQVQSSDASTVTTVIVGPAVDYFVWRSLSVGVHMLWNHVAVTDLPTTDSINTGVRVGYAFRLGDFFSFWPKVNIDYRHTSLLTIAAFSGNTGLGASETSADSLALGAYAPVLFHPVAHFFLGLGPTVDAIVLTSPSSADKATQYGLLFTVGGWLTLGPG